MLETIVKVSRTGTKLRGLCARVYMQGFISKNNNLLSFGCLCLLFFNVVLLKYQYNLIFTIIMTQFE